MSDRVDVIATTISGSISDWGKVKKVVPLFREFGREDVHLNVAHSHAEARKIACDRIGEGTRVLISAGGSGTFNGVLEGCIDSGVGLNELTLGFMRKGSADLIGKALDMPDEVVSSVRTFVTALSEGTTVPCDVIEAAGGDAVGRSRHFVGYAGAEIFGRIPHYTENRLIKYYKGLLGQLFGDMGPFFVGAMLAMTDKALRRIGRSRMRWKIDVDGERRAENSYQAMILVNGDLGPDLPFARSVPLGSGDFHLFALRDIGMHRLPGQFRRAWDGSVQREPERYGFEHYRVGESLRLEPGSDRPFPVNVDGSTLICRSHVGFKIVDRINLIAAAR